MFINYHRKLDKVFSGIFDRVLWFNFLVLGITLVLSAYIFADTSVSSFPIFVSIDGSYSVQSSMYLKCEHITYKQSLISLGKLTSRKKSEDKLIELTYDIYAKDLLSLSQIGNRTDKVSNNDFEEIVNSYKQMINNPDMEYDINKMKILEQIYLGSNRLFIWEMPGSIDKGSPKLIRAFKFTIDNHNDFIWDFSNYDKLSVLLTHSIQHMGDSLNISEMNGRNNFDYEYLIAGSESENPVYLQFNGQKYNVNILTGTIDETNEVALFYQKTCQAFHEDGSLAHAAFYTTKSKQKYIDWYSKMSDEQRNAYKNDTIDIGRTLLFVIDANPIYIAFYKFNNSNAMIGHDYIIRSPENNQLKLTNFYYGTYLDHLIKDKNLFYESILKQKILQQD